MSPLLIKISKDLKLIRYPRLLAPTLVAFTFITRTARCLCQLPSCVAVYPRDSRSHVFYVADPLSSIRMSPLLIKISKDFATLWTTIDPIGNVALFAGLTASLTRRPLILAGNAARGEPVAHRGVFGRRGRTPFGEFLALFRQQFH